MGKPPAKTRTREQSPNSRGPGLVKSRDLPLLDVHPTNLVRCSDYLVRELFERADVMSEGDVDRGRGEPTYYGTTSILLTLARREPRQAPTPAAALRYLRLDPHARTRAIRIACREAQVRCQVPLHRIRAELNVRATRDGVRFDVEIEAAASRSSSVARR